MQQQHTDRPPVAQQGNAADEDQEMVEALASQTEELAAEDAPTDWDRRYDAMNLSAMSFGKSGATTDEALLNRAESIRNWLAQ